MALTGLQSGLPAVTAKDGRNCKDLLFPGLTQDDSETNQASVLDLKTKCCSIN